MIESKLREIANQFAARKVLIVGDMILDEYVWGEVNRISPEAPVPVLEIKNRSFLPGGAGNTAANVATLGGHTILLGSVGDDPQADALKQTLSEHGVDATHLISDTTRPTTVKTRIIASSQQIVRTDYERTHALAADLQAILSNWMDELFIQAEVCILSDYEKGVLHHDFCRVCIEKAQKANVPVIVDPKGRDFSKYKGASILKPNLNEAEQALNRKISSDQDVEQAGRKLLQLVEGSALLITRGPKGMTIIREGQEPYHIPAATRNVYDVTGAGDTVVSVLALALATGASLEDAAQLANRAAGIVVGKVGAATVTLDELLGD